MVLGTAGGCGGDDAGGRQRLSRRVAATLRWDIFNVFNTVNFGLPNRDISSPSTFGTISSLSSDPRTMQLAVRLTF